MPRFILTATDADGTTTTKTFDSEFLGEIVEKTDEFLRGVGFVYEDLSVKYSDDHTIPNIRTGKPESIYRDNIHDNSNIGIE